MSVRFQIGRWTFLPDSHELLSEGARVKLEHRAALALHLLCERRGQVVTKAELSERLWGGRQVSPNSLAVVIRDLRKALGDDARAPVFLETVAKAGYRLEPQRDGVALPPPAVARPRRMWAAGALVAAVGVVGLAGWVVARSPPPGPTPVLVGAVTNATGNKAYDALASASDGLVMGALGDQPGVKLCRSAACVENATGTPALRFETKLVLWSGYPDLEFSAEDLRSSEVVWSGRAFGPEGTLPQKTRLALAEFAHTLAKRRPPPRR